MDMSASKVKDIIGDCPRFCSPDCEPYGYYIVSEEIQVFKNIGKS